MSVNYVQLAVRGRGANDFKTTTDNRVNWQEGFRNSTARSRNCWRIFVVRSALRPERAG
jgi:hypothetical protein